jgi:hypothetical protein
MFLQQQPEIQGVKFDMTISLGQVVTSVIFLVGGGAFFQRYHNRVEAVEKANSAHDEAAKTRGKVLEELERKLGTILDWRRSHIQIVEQQHTLLTKLNESMIGLLQWRESHSEVADKQDVIISELKDTVIKLTTISDLYIPHIPFIEAQVSAQKNRLDAFLAKPLISG